ncbi:MAG: 1,4-dihydroxy-2-naphthoate octaprenyltransferase [Flavobacteriaceae bacterium]|nr:1,4-dihydroxy-2-naphthoate octaprenyltransferase [Flavobacteriaceae bacterium]
MSKTKAWLNAARLRTLPLSFSGIIVGSALAFRENAFELPIFILALLTTLGFQVLSNFANDYGDGVKGTDNDERVGPKRALQSGLLTETELKKGMVITIILTLVVTVLLIYRSFGTENLGYIVLFLLLGIAAIIAAIKYTVGVNAYGYRAMGDVFVFVFFGLLSVLGSYFLHVQQLSFLMLLPAISIGLLSTSVLNLNNMRDRISDAKVNKITIPVLLGEKNAKKYHAFLLLGAYTAAFLYFYFSGVVWWQFLPLFAFLPLLKHYSVVVMNRNPAALDSELKKVALSTFFFSVLFFGIAIF